MKRLSLLLWLLLPVMAAQAQTDISKLPVTVKPAVSGSDRPLVFYITGDGGMKKFSVDIVNAFAGRGYPVVGLNALKYFWNKKTPQQASADVAALLQHYGDQWNNHTYILVGYSMGADVLPFIYQQLPEALKEQTRQLVFLSPSRSTDMEVHLSDMLGKSSREGSMNVPAAMNAITAKPLLLLFGQSEKDFDLKELTIHNYRHLVLPGGHRYDDNADGVVQNIVEHLYAEKAR